MEATRQLGRKCSNGDMHEPAIRTPQTRPRPGRRRHSYYLPFKAIYTLVLTLLMFSLLNTPTEATHQQASRIRKSRGIGRIGEILCDARPAPEPTLHRRAEASGVVAQDSNATKTTSSSVGTSILSAPTDTNSPLPKPFDGGIGTNFTQPSCPTFIKSMVSNDTFTSCLPFSLLLQVSPLPFPSKTTRHLTFRVELSLFLRCFPHPLRHNSNPQCILQHSIP